MDDVAAKQEPAPKKVSLKPATLDVAKGTRKPLKLADDLRGESVAEQRPDHVVEARPKPATETPPGQSVVEARPEPVTETPRVESVVEARPEPVVEAGAGPVAETPGKPVAELPRPEPVTETPRVESVVEARPEPGVEAEAGPPAERLGPPPTEIISSQKLKAPAPAAARSATLSPPAAMPPTNRHPVETERVVKTETLEAPEKRGTDAPLFAATPIKEPSEAAVQTERVVKSETLRQNSGSSRFSYLRQFQRT